MKKKSMVTKKVGKVKSFFTIAIITTLFLTPNIMVKDEVQTTKDASVNIGSLVKQFTKAIKPSSFIDSWGKEKNNWLGAAKKVKDPAALASSIGSLAGFIKPGLFKGGFDVQNLISSASSIKTMAESTGLLKSLEGGLKPEAMEDSWAGKRAGWLSALDLIK